MGEEIKAGIPCLEQLIQVRAVNGQPHLTDTSLMLNDMRTCNNLKQNLESGLDEGNPDVYIFA